MESWPVLRSESHIERRSPPDLVEERKKIFFFCFAKSIANAMHHTIVLLVLLAAVSCCFEFGTPGWALRKLVWVKDIIVVMRYCDPSM